MALKCQQNVQRKIWDDDNQEAKMDYFKISVNVLEAKNLLVVNQQQVDSFVVVMLGKEKYKTSVKKHMIDPCYRDYFLFEWYTNIREVVCSSVWLAVMESRRYGPPRSLGEATLDLANIWKQPNHQILHKWVQLNLPREWGPGVAGFLRVDVSIACRGDDNQLWNSITSKGLFRKSFPFPGGEQQTAMYILNIYNAFGLSFGKTSKDALMKQPNTFVKVSFCGLSAKTGIYRRSINPSYCQRISLVEVFPSVCQTARIEVFFASTNSYNLLGYVHLNLGQISHDGEHGFIPTFGPSLLYLYGSNTIDCTASKGMNIEEGPYYKGCILVALKTIVPYDQQEIGSINVDPIPSQNLDDIWVWENFYIFCPVLEVSMLDPKIAGKYYGIAITMGDVQKENKKGDGDRKLHYTGSINVTETNKVYSHLDLSDAFPVLQLATQLPDFRYRMYRRNFLQRIIRILDTTIEYVESRLLDAEVTNASELFDQLKEAIDAAAENIFKLIEVNQQVNSCLPETELDQKQLALQINELEKIYVRITSEMKTQSSILRISSSNEIYNESVSKKELKKLLGEAKILAKNLRTLIFPNLDGWPNIIIWLLRDGSRYAYYRISPANVIYSSIPEQGGKDCARIQTVYLKPLKCSEHLDALQSCNCIAGKLELFLWMGLHSETAEFEDSLINGYKLHTQEYNVSLISSSVVLELRSIIYRADLFVAPETTYQFSSFVRINFMNFFKETKVEQKTSNPIWDQLIILNCKAHASFDRIVASPPLAVVEVLNQTVKKKLELIGRSEIEPSVQSSISSGIVPTLKWYDLFNGTQKTGRILMALQIAMVVINPFYLNLTRSGIFDDRFFSNVTGCTILPILGALICWKYSATCKPPESLIKSIVYTSTEEINYFNNTNDDNLSNEEYTIGLPQYLKSKLQTYKTEHYGSNGARDLKLEAFQVCLNNRLEAIRVDVYFWGLRGYMCARKPCAVIEIDGFTIKSDIINDNKINCNFPNGRSANFFVHAITESHLPKLTMKIYGSSTFGRTTFLGLNAVKNSHKYKVNWLSKHQRDKKLRTATLTLPRFSKEKVNLLTTKTNSPRLENDGNNNIGTQNSSHKSPNRFPTWKALFKRRELNEEEYVLLPMPVEDQTNILSVNTGKDNEDWWERFFASEKDLLEDSKNTSRSPKIKIFHSELENQPQFSKFKDWCQSVKLHKGQKSGDLELDEKLESGILKIGVAIYSWPPSPGTIAVSDKGVDLQQGFFNEYPNNDPALFLVRVYIVRCLELNRLNFIGLSDSYYVVIKCGTKVVSDRQTFVSNKGNPVFGKYYEFICSLPDDYLLTISLFNNETLLPTDNLIGSTKINVEDRIYSKHRARVGLCTEYKITGNAKWRDVSKPSEILVELCKSNHISPPSFADSDTVVLNGIRYKYIDESDKNYITNAERKENICLNILLQWNTFPICGYHLVPEHVETRKLLHPDKPGLEQGRVQMWVDTYPVNSNVPLPVNITPRETEAYELRVIIWRARLITSDSKISKKPLAVYVKAWIGNENEAQFTDMRILNEYGEYKFNWRMIFHFSYQHFEKKLVKCEMTSIKDTHEGFPPVLIVQVVSSDENLNNKITAFLALDLNDLPRHQESENVSRIEKDNLFEIKFVRSWWHLKTQTYGYEDKFTSMIDLELSLLPKEKALMYPVGVGQETPFQWPLASTPKRWAERFPIPSNSSGLRNFFNIGSAEYFVLGAFSLLIVFTLVLLWELPNIKMHFLI